MATQAFDISTGTVTDTSSVVVGSGEVARVRFTSWTGDLDAFIGITRNAVTSYLPISPRRRDDLAEVVDRNVFIPPALAGDTVFLRVQRNDPTAAAAGILETL